MLEVYREHNCSVIGVQRVAREDTASYGIVDTETIGARLHRIRRIVEQPKPEDAPPTLAVVGRHILTPRIFEMLRNVKPGAGGEIQLTDGIAALLEHEQVIAYEFEGRRYDCGSKIGYLQATVEYGLEHPEVGEKFRAYLKKLEM